jgi:endonuclease/exonuclease/phosphatase family metal-dependent hydrolase
MSNDSNSSLDLLPMHGYLTYDEFYSVYKTCIQYGKMWAVSYDFAVCGFPLPLSDEVFMARYDRAYVSGGAVVKAVRHTIDHTKEISCLPSSQHASDHLPILVVVDINSNVTL